MTERLKQREKENPALRECGVSVTLWRILSTTRHAGWRVSGLSEATVTDWVRMLVERSWRPGPTRNVEKTILHQGIEHGGVQYLRLSNMQFLQNVSTSAASAGVLTQPRPKADIAWVEILQRSMSGDLI